MRRYWLLVLILFLAAFLRFYQLTNNPPALNWDEISHGYNAYSILKTGKDEWGQAWPMIFRAYGDYKLPVYIYLTSLSEAIFGLNDFAVRFPSALAGVLSVLFTYLLTRKLFSKEKFFSFLPLIASLFLAVSPWHIFLSRPAFEANLASLLVIVGIYFFLMAIEKEWWLIPSIFFLGLSVHTYNSARILVPLILIVLLWLYHDRLWRLAKKRKTEMILAVLVLLFFFIPLLVSFISPAGRARFQLVTILDQGTINRINMARTSSPLPGFLPVLIHNKATYFTTIFTRNYLLNLSPAYLFFRGGTNYQYNIPSRGVIYPIELPLILIGICWLIENWQRKEVKLMSFWWLLAVIPAAATRDNPHVLRTILVLPIPQIISALGFCLAWEWWQKRFKRTRQYILPLSYGLLLILLVINFWLSYFGSYRQKYSWSWQYGYQQVASFIKNHYQDYDRIFFTKRYGEPHEFLLFYLKWNPEAYQNDPNLVRYFKSNWYWVDSFDKFVFINDWEVKTSVKCQNSNVKCLLIASPENYPEGWSKIETINFLDNQPAFEVLER